jgi:hypothetical protein
MRFLHEYNKLKSSVEVGKSCSLIVVKISRPAVNISEVAGGAGGVRDSHISENEYIDIPYDVEIINDGAISDLTDLFDIYYDSREGIALIEGANM